VRICADQSVRIEDAIFLEHALGEIFEIHLMHDTDTRRDDFESFEGLHAPLEKLITRLVAFEFHFHVQAQGVGRGGEIDLNRVVDDQIDGDERFDHFRFFIQARGGGAHGGEINQKRHASEILQNDARDDEGDFRGAIGGRFPIRERANVLFADFFTVEIAEHRFEHDANANGEP
jgi:hypothetical protein